MVTGRYYVVPAPWFGPEDGLSPAIQRGRWHREDCPLHQIAVERRARCLRSRGRAWHDIVPLRGNLSGGEKQQGLDNLLQLKAV